MVQLQARMWGWTSSVIPLSFFFISAQLPGKCAALALLNYPSHCSLWDLFVNIMWIYYHQHILTQSHRQQHMWLFFFFFYSVPSISSPHVAPPLLTPSTPVAKANVDVNLLPLGCSCSAVSWAFWCFCLPGTSSHSENLWSSHCRGWTSCPAAKGLFVKQ